MSRIDGKFAVVTGSTQGLGLEIARHFARSGAAGIVTCGRGTDKGKLAAEEIARETGIQTKFVTADLSSVDDCRSVIAALVGEFGRIDILVNAAAKTDRGTLVDTSQELFDSMFAINVRGPFFLMQEAVKAMISSNVQGSIVNIGSMSAYSGQPFITAYCASKGALATLTRNAAFALLHNRIRVNQLNIGWMNSEGEDAIQRKYHGAGDDWLDKAGGEQPYGRLVEPAEVARAAAFLASEESGLMSGAVINFDQSVWGSFETGAPLPTGPMAID